MTTENDWLTTLENATSYGELQSAFARMIAESTSTDDGDALAARIDEAIRRIELERSRDQAELNGFSNEYEAFKQQQSGVIGWFKRKLPFTETRKQELGHRDAVNDQAAEILADNFVIARAQMLKERIASPNLRRLGQQPLYWRNQLLQHDSVESIRQYGSVVHSLGQELAIAKQFCDHVSIEIEAFAAAKFTEQENQRRRNDDLILANSELKALQDEVQEKAKLRKAALVTLQNLLISELSEKDAEFNDTNRRLSLAKSLIAHHPQLFKLMSEEFSLVKSLLAKIIEKKSLPERREELDKAIRSLQRDFDDADHQRLRSVRELEEPSRLYNAALQEAQQAKAAFNASKPLYDAYIAEQSKNANNDAEVTADFNFDMGVSGPNVVSEYKKLEQASLEAAQTLTSRTPVFEQAKRGHDHAVTVAEDYRRKLDAKTQEFKQISELDSDLHQQIQKFKQSIDSAVPELQRAVQAYLDAASNLTSPIGTTAAIHSIQSLLQETGILNTTISPFSINRSFAASFDSNSVADLQRDCQRLEKAIQALEEDHKSRQREVLGLAKLRTEALQNRGRMLFDESLNLELNFD